MKEEPLVSVIIPCYNCKTYVKEAVLSIIEQSYRNLEIYITDDCSNDGTYQIIRKIARQDSRIHIIRHKENQRIVSCLNEMLVFVKGAYIARMDADDVAAVNRIEEQVRYMERHPECTVCGCQAVYIDKYGRKIGNSHMPEGYEESRLFARYFSPVIHPSAMIRAEVFKNEKYSPFYLYCEDYELWMRLIYKNQMNIASLHEQLLKYRITEEQTTAKHFKEQLINCAKIFDLYDAGLGKWKEIHKEIFFIRSKRIDGADLYIKNILRVLKTQKFYVSAAVAEKMIFYLLRFYRGQAVKILLTPYGIRILVWNVYKKARKKYSQIFCIKSI